jgi:hypothetical protein
MHQAHIALGNHFRDRQAVAAIAHGDLGHEPQMAGDQLLRRTRIFMFLVALGQHVLFIRFQHRELADFLKIAAEATFG